MKNPSMINIIITFTNLPAIKPTKTPRADLNARGMVLLLISSPMNAPSSGPIIIPQGPNIKMPIINPTKTL